jgi:thiamine-phosphate pyrophosphorylase
VDRSSGPLSPPHPTVPMSAPRLYLVAPPLVTEAALSELAALMDAVPIACLRLTPAAATEAEIRRAADPLRALCHARDVSLVLADHFRLAPALGLDGVHLTSGPRHVREARRHLGPDAIVGAFCGASRHEGITAGEIGADYVSFGPVTDTPLAAGPVAPLELFAWWSEMIEIPVIAEGGLTPDAAAALAPHTDFLAVGPEIWSDPEGPRAALDALRARLPAA